MSDTIEPRRCHDGRASRNERTCSPACEAPSSEAPAAGRKHFPPPPNRQYPANAPSPLPPRTTLSQRHLPSPGTASRSSAAPPPPKTPRPTPSWNHSASRRSSPRSRTSRKGCLPEKESAQATQSSFSCAQVRRLGRNAGQESQKCGELFLVVSMKQRKNRHPTDVEWRLRKV